jgi:hypothetical protein
MDLIGEFTRRLYWEMAPFFNWALNHWAISLMSLFLLIRWAGHRHRTRIKAHHISPSMLFTRQRVKPSS